MKIVCEKLKKINTDYKGCVDELAAQYERDSAAALSERGGFVTLKLLEKHTGGRIKAPDMESFGKELGEIRGHFNSIKYYRGGLASIAPANEWGHALHPATMSGIQQGLIEHFAERLDDFAERWACVSGETGSK